MRRSILGAAFLAVCATLAAPTGVQAQALFATGSLGATAGTLGSRPAGVFTFGANTPYEWMSFGIETGVLPGADFDDAQIIAPGVSVPGAAASEVRVNKLHYNGNLFIRPALHDRLRPYVTVGIGGITARVSEKDGSGFTVPESSRTRHNPAVNVGGGVLVPLNEWLGITAGYRHFIFMGPSVTNVNRIMAGVSLSTP